MDICESTTFDLYPLSDESHRRLGDKVKGNIFTQNKTF